MKGEVERERKFSDVSMRSFESWGKGSDDGLPSEEWELEAYLRDLESIDREKAVAGEGFAR